MFDSTSLHGQVLADLAKAQVMTVIVTKRGLRRRRMLARGKGLPGLDVAEALQMTRAAFIPASQFPELAGQDLADIPDLSRS
ncbi:MAG: hypothetical protein UW46_C0007G0028 [Candidatus Yanofskybacteria bacterium GW2011_GWF1_44_227]|uniref:Uncharacterized protein n=1 Tax=Candidatus Yanofskybacteria bacterium GW2011_GWE2_40_11 TaxID=1619033 RepID=A0A0G0QI00_9BACT|nr:MAG: hypothetical protein UT69_C0014G0008 [Candidatus Yanofskybacteria bacterium GW2011_GWE1_40_10]KKR39999.1 MAG: hypothetical protein UT75_C0011G0027 [Candidatus Yanofskybacteria bacterium GW2011_GWE2_40_11]KKT15368.1 MAG: hypothetical protein UV97_C0008G0017 [Candidatus Yanofskybacteria bacterium GW2011_GWF2_43_596]KKT53052.1 MAG: hypothetical protein UW46_C0007G0028 [Candidatus Yanofskybacteria bacterium GW2011_GWF1_44_227]OGN35734.1 MAG: hypothetical protein A2241_02515 [Candidatus Yano